MTSNLPRKTAVLSDLMLKRIAKRSLGRHLQRVDRRVIRLAANRGKQVERIHELRTESRRAEAALKLFADFLPGKLAKEMHQCLSRLRSIAGSVRDRDVLKEILDEFDPQLPLHVRHWLKGQMQRSRARKLETLMRHCRRIREQGFENEITKLTRSVEWPKEDHDEVRKQFLRHSIDRVANPLLDSISHLKQDEKQFHRVRICGRRLRYTIDLLQVRLPETAVAPIRDLLSKLQSILGRAHDRVSLLQFIQTRADKYPHADGSLVSLLGSLERENADVLRLSVHQSIELADQLPKLLRDLTSLPSQGKWLDVATQ